MTSRIALGTAQFGQTYGIANSGSQVSRAEAGKIIQQAANSGLDTLDTAPAYSASESWLGEIGVGDWRVITKIPAIPAGCDNISGWVAGSIEKSLERLGLERLEGVLLHHPSDLLGPHGTELYATLESLRAEAKLRQIGVSVYDPSEVAAFTARYKLDIVQAPYNVLDRRMKISGMLDKLQNLGVEFHARSAFLQGLLLMSPTKRPPYFAKWSTVWEKWHEWLNDNGVTAVAACLRVVLSNSSVSKLVVGVDSEHHLADIVHAAALDISSPPDSLACDDVKLLNPSNWPKR